MNRVMSANVSARTVFLTTDTSAFITLCTASKVYLQKKRKKKKRKLLIFALMASVKVKQLKSKTGK